MGVIIGGYYSQGEPPVGAQIITRLPLRVQAAALTQPDVNALPQARLALRAAVSTSVPVAGEPLSRLALRATVAASGSRDTITLSGTSGTPNSHGSDGSSPQEYGWVFKTNGTVWQTSGSGFTEDTQFQDGTQWNGSQDSPTDDYWIRFTQQAFGDGGGTRQYKNASLGAWLKVSGSGSSDRGFGCDDVSGDGPTNFTVFVEIAADSQGQHILDDGYYDAWAEVTDV